MSERDKRVARVAERALAPPAESDRRLTSELRADEPEVRRGTGSGSIFNLFNLTKPRIPDETDDDVASLGDPFDDAKTLPAAGSGRNGTSEKLQLDAEDNG